jgi:uncharacterized membrane protein
MLSFLADWLNLIFRWAHMIAGIGWIGTSFYFIALDFSLKRRDTMNPGVAGTAWEVHGGGFYHVEKYMSAPPELPPDLLWYKWEAYATWLTGFLLLVVQFYWHADIYLIDPTKLPLAWYDAVAISLGGLVGGWLVYDALCRSALSRNPAALAAAVFFLIVAAAWGFTHAFSGRGALVHVGAFIGTLMAANVFLVIIPNQRLIASDLIAGRSPDPSLGLSGKNRSLHNTYLTLPVLLFMVSNHYPMLTDHPHAWLLVALVVVGGAGARHFLIRHDVGDPLSGYAWTLPFVFGSLLIAVVLTAPRPVDTAGAAIVPDDAAMAIARTHCTACHARRPTHEGINEAPKATRLETTAELLRYADLVLKQAVASHTMPPGNETGMTEKERRTLGLWIAQNR